MAELMTKIEIAAELRPALLVMRGCEDMEVLVHTVKTGRHGGFIVEDKYGALQEVQIEPPACTLKYVDDKHAEYVFPKAYDSGGAV